MGNLARSAALGLDSFEIDPVELWPNSSEDTLQEVIRAAYRQVLGNQHLMEGDRLVTAETLLRNGDISIRGFIRSIAQSDLYRSLFFETSSQYRFVELNFKHLLGRPPLNQSEIAEHVQRYNDNGYDAEINSYIDSAEYIDAFGEDKVPYPRSIRSQVGLKNQSFNRMFALLRGPATHSGKRPSQLVDSIAANLPMSITAPAQGNGAYTNTSKRFRVSYAANQSSARMGRVSKQSCSVSYDQLSATVQRLHKSGSKILSITEEV